MKRSIALSLCLLLLSACQIPLNSDLSIWTPRKAKNKQADLVEGTQVSHIEDSQLDEESIP